MNGRTKIGQKGHRAIAALLAAAVLSCGPTRGPDGPSAGAPPPRLVVLIVVDQFPAWAFTRREHLLQHGLARLVREGVTYPTALYPYASTATAPGHAALSTGAPPAVTGILANTWWERTLDRQKDSVEDLDHPLLDVQAAPGAPSPEDGSSPARLKVDTVGDVLIRERPGAKVVGVALKDRGAINVTGHHGLAVWYDAKQAAFTTSTWYAKTPPAWLERLAKERPIAPRLRVPWSPLDAALLARETGVPDDAPGEASVHGLGVTFPHVADPAEASHALTAIPLGNEAVLEAALAAIDGEDLGADDVPDLLAISFSASDYVGHYWGQESWEALDMFLRLDRHLGDLLDTLDRRVGRGRYAVVLTGDHGVTRTIERTLERGRSARRIDPAEIETACEEAASAVAGDGDWISAGRDPAIYLSPAARALPDETRSRVIDAVLAAVAKIDGVGYAFRADRLAGGCDERPEVEALVCRSIDPERSGEIYFSPSEGSVVMRPPWDATGHGSLNRDDREVPVILVTPRAVARRVDGTISTLRIAPTIANLLRVSGPPTATQPALDTGY